LFVSSAAKPPPAALRGGTPLCWPQFASKGAGPKHGFARTSSKWKVLGSSIEPAPTVTFELCDDDDTQAAFPSKFRVLYHITLPSDSELTIAMQVMNKGEEPFEFTTALHTYFRVPSIGAVSIDGLNGITYEDSAAPLDADGKPPRVVESSEQVRIAGEVDRVYLGAPDRLTLQDGTDTIHLLSQGFKDAVVWNIGAEKATAMDDLGAGEWENYVCIESAVVDKPVKLQAHGSWMGGVTYTLASPQ